MQLLSLILTFALCGPLVQCLEQALRDHILKIHNDYRKNVKNACQMERMVYDMALERQASEWVNWCVFKHEMITGRGENLAWNSAHKDETELMNIATKSWYDEVKFYTYGPHSCVAVCHYTQMVWGKTNRVGCATKRCPYLTGGWKDSWYLACFYLPGGNMIGKVPYEVNCTKPCRDGQTQDSEGLCVGGGGSGNDNAGTSTASTPSSTGSSTGSTSTSGPCVDRTVDCPRWAKDGHCNRNPQYMNRNCKFSCGRCGDCKDLDASCPSWAEDDQCEKNPKYMLVNCKRSCHQC